MHSGEDAAQQFALIGGLGQNVPASEYQDEISFWNEEQTLSAQAHSGPGQRLRFSLRKQPPLKAILPNFAGIDEWS